MSIHTMVIVATVSTAKSAMQGDNPDSSVQIGNNCNESILSVVMITMVRKM